MNAIITDDSVRFSSTVSSVFEKPPLDAKARQILKTDDLQFVQRQIDLFSDMRIQPDKLKRTGWRVLQKRNISPFVKLIPAPSDTILHTYFSFPIISADRTKVIFTLGSGGVFMGGGYGTYFYERRNGKWMLIDSWDIIIV